MKIQGTKRYSYSYEEYEENDVNAATMLEEILADEEFTSLNELVIGCWGEAWEDSPQPIINGIVQQPEKFSHIDTLFVGDIDFEECELSWIIQGDYSKLWGAMPQLERLVIKGSTELELGDISHNNLKELEIICGGLQQSCFDSIQEAKLPELQKLFLCIGIEDYGFEGDVNTLKEFLEKTDFPKLTYLGLADSEIQDDVAKLILESKYIDQISTLDLSLGTLTDKGGALLLEEIPKHPNIKKIDLTYHFLSDEMVEKLKGLSGVEVILDEPQEPEEYDGEVYYYAMLTE